MGARAAAWGSATATSNAASGCHRMAEIELEGFEKATRITGSH
jgi:hypothetical protein